ncbi:MAG TPA: LLM class F420-dependent oxidoreductase [Steroidobacteraceae bacterium]|nr:LLM class F420-dependent oxidoreductase [Steroidobacteraceae bacterium]
MKIGAVYPQVELRGDPEAVRRIGTQVETLGLDYLLAYDHVLGANHERREPKLTGPYTEQHPFHDPLLMFAHIAGLTRRLELVTGVLILPQRQTALVARQVADLDLLSGGRFRLGVGVGWNYVEYRALGEDFTTRGRRLDEQIELLRRLWSEPLVEFAGRFDRIERAALNPRPSRRIPIWFGGFSEPAYRRAARIGDGFIFTGPVERSTAGWSQVEQHLRAAGRDPAEFGREMIVGRFDKTPEEVAARLAWCREWGCTHAAVDTMGKGLASAAAHLDFLAQVMARMHRATWRP